MKRLLVALSTVLVTTILLVSCGSEVDVENPDNSGKETQNQETTAGQPGETTSANAGETADPQTAAPVDPMSILEKFKDKSYAEQQASSIKIDGYTLVDPKELGYETSEADADMGEHKQYMFKGKTDAATNITSYYNVIFFYQDGKPRSIQITSVGDVEIILNALFNKEITEAILNQPDYEISKYGDNMYISRMDTYYFEETGKADEVTIDIDLVGNYAAAYKSQEEWKAEEAKQN